VSYALKSAYESLLYSQDLRKLTQDIIRRREQNLKLVQLHYESGTENKGSVLLYKAYLAQAKYEDLQAQNAQKVAQAQLLQVLGIQQPEEIVIKDQIPVQEPNAEPDFMEMALKIPTHEQAVAQEQAAHAGVAVNRSTFFPTLSLTGSTGKLGEHYFPDEQNRWSVGASLTFPLFSGGKDYGNYESALYNYYSSSHNRAFVDQGLYSSLRQSYNTYAEAAQKLKVDESFQNAAVVRADIARGQYNNGLLNFQDWDNIETDLINRQKNYLTSKQNRVLTEAAWEQARGEGVIP
jgi:outer membrane protein TolC